MLAQASRSADYPTLSGAYTVTGETYYDNYDWTSGTGMSSSLVTTNINSTNFITSYNAFPVYAQPIAVGGRIRGAVTGGKKIIIGTGTYLYSLPLYDSSGRVVQVKEKNITGGTDVVTSQYSFSGRVLRVHLAHEKSGSNSQTHTLLTKYLYDHAGRVDSIIKNIDGTGDKLIASNTYNELGQVIAKKLAPAYNSNAGLETLTYEYNIRGWLLGMNRDFVKDVNTTAWFGYEVAYDNTNNIISGQSYAAAQYNGNITGLTWKSTGDDQKRKYDFTYDYANRLLAADFNQYTGSSFNKTAGVDFSVSNLSYDANGNILTMTQKGLKINTSPVIDYLSYSYSSNTNKLTQVADTANNFSSLLGDFKYDAGYKTSTDYSYDVNGSVSKDKNKFIDTIQYNYLNLPDYISYYPPAAQYGGPHGNISYVYDAAGVKLQKIVTDYISQSNYTTTTTTYAAGFVYESKSYSIGGTNYTDSLLFTGHEEGRIRKKGSGFVYDYFIRDHIGNIRMMLTEDTQSDQYPAATMETASATTEETYYSNLPATRENLPSGYPTISGNAKVAKTSGGGNKIGPAIVLKVMAGDKFSLAVNSWWKSTNTPGTPNSPLTDLVSAMNGSIGGMAGNHASGTELTNTNVLSAGATSFLNNQSYNSSLPKAFINWILFDEQFNYVSSNSGFEQVGNSDTYSTHTRTNQSIDKSGYLYVYVSNETPNIDVFFDNLQITHDRGPLLQEDHYYPFGLTMSGISSKALSFGQKNSYKFNGGVELDQDFGMDLYKCFFRQYDPQIGRFSGIDIMAEEMFFFSPYIFAYNNPISFNDPLGDRPPSDLPTYIPGSKGLYKTKDGRVIGWNEMEMFLKGSGSLTHVWSSNQTVDGEIFSIGYGNSRKTGADGFRIGYSFLSTPLEGKTNVGIGSAFISFGDFQDVKGRQDVYPYPSYDYFEGNWMNPTQATVGGIGVVTGGFEHGFTKSTLGYGYKKPWYKLKIHSNGWPGNRYVSTFNISKTAKVAGRLSFGVSTFLDGVGVYNYYTKGPNNPNSVHPAKAGLNLGVGVYTLAGGPPAWAAGGFYYLVDNTIGWKSYFEGVIFMEQQKAILREYNIMNYSDWKY